MKKIITLILALLMCIPFAACGKTEVNNQDDIAQEQLLSGTEQETETNTPEQLPSEDTEEAAKETENVTEDDIVESFEETTGDVPEVQFNRIWGETGIEMPIPEPPFPYEVTVKDTGVKISTVSDGSNASITHDMILKYCSTLKDIGYNQDVVENEIGYRYGRTCYEFKASNGNDSSVELVDDGGGVVIFVYFPISSASDT